MAAPKFIVSQKQLVVVGCCKNGILGTFPALNNRVFASGYTNQIL
jgi:hypothetical protein